jgi:hypothetical protein
MVGVKSKRLFDLSWRPGRSRSCSTRAMSDAPGRARVWEYWRVSVGAHHPTETSLMRRKMPTDRFEALGLDVAPWRSRGNQIVIAGSSAKYHAFYGLPEPNDYYSAAGRAISGPDRPADHLPAQAELQGRGADRGHRVQHRRRDDHDALWGAHALVTHGSNACFEAALLGVPSIVLGDAVAAPISSRSLDEIETTRSGASASSGSRTSLTTSSPSRSSRTGWRGSTSAGGSMSFRDLARARRRRSRRRGHHQAARPIRAR